MFIRLKNKKYAAKRIVDQISYLQYSSTKEPIDYSIKIVIVQVMNELVSGQREFQSERGETIKVNPQDAVSLAKLNNKILEMLWLKHQRKENELQIDLKSQGMSPHTFTLNFLNVNSSVFRIAKNIKTKSSSCYFLFNQKQLVLVTNNIG